ncbi:uncharacterized protein LOC130994574 isoform X2 [Salvia miltiorrhiza]|uniref:uncharacterized protein LOC130994574 isoform X2 n=1 Tax=Salvia miltiorrhiza TaxID=226208 RepID=UPI0025ACE030|nr:uncharacterized protein LOC130994574 isoform X2 [Salvia miltiorrhiza]
MDAYQLSADAAAWNVLGLLLSKGRPTHPSELTLRSTPDSIRFLCSIPNSPLRLADDDLVTVSPIGAAALAQFLLNSDLITRYLDLPHFVPGLLAHFRLNALQRTYCRKRKRVPADEDFLTTKTKRFDLDLNDVKSSNQIAITIPHKFENVTTQGISSLPTLSVFDCWNLERDVFIPEAHRKSEFNSETENAAEAEIPNMQISSTRHGPQIMAEELLNYVPSPKRPSHPLSSNFEEGGGIGDNGIVDHVINSMTISASSKLDEQMIVTQKRSDAVAQGCDSLTEGVDGKIKEVFVHDPGSCKGHKEHQSIDRIHKTKYDKDNAEKALPKSDNKGRIFIRARTEGHLQSQGDMLNHSMKHSSTLNLDTRRAAYDRKNDICPTKEKRKRLTDKAQEQCKRDKTPVSVQQTKKIDCDQIENTKEKRDASAENKEKPSSISNNIKQESFPEFESFIVEQEEGSGGYGTVYRARRKDDGVIFAIKCPHANANKNYVNNEIKMLERLGGRNFVIKYEGSFKSKSAVCLVLQHVQHDRPEILKRDMNVADLQWYGYCLFKALAGLHRQGFVHRDVKPGNFLYSRKVNKGYLIDFNLALDMHKKYGTAVNKNAGKVCRSLLPPGNLKRKVDKSKVITEASGRNIIKSQGADGSGVTSAKDATSTRTECAERLREPLPCHGRRELLSLVQEAMQNGNHGSVDAPKSKRKRVAAPAGDAGTKLLYVTPMPLHANGNAIRGAGQLKSKDGKPAREGPCAGTKGFKAPEVLFRSLHQGPRADIWAAGVTLLYLMIGRTPFTGDAEQNIKEIAKLRGSEALWEVAKLHSHESVFSMDLLDVKYLTPMSLQDWCAQNTRRQDFFDAIPSSLFDLVDKCLMVNPRQRISADEALAHDFFAPCHEALRKHRLRRQARAEAVVDQ